MRFHGDVRVLLGVLVLVPMLGGCDPKSTEVGATANFDTPTSGDDSGGSSDTGFGFTDCQEEDWIPLITGTVHREVGDHTWNESFEPTAEAFISLLLVTYYPDGSSIGHIERLEPFEGLPFDFALCASEAWKFESDEDYDLWVHVFNHDTTELQVGDLADQYLYPIEEPTFGLQVVVAGVESCDAPNADELCSTIE